MNTPPSRRINKKLGVTSEGVAAQFLLTDYEVVSSLWKKLHAEATQTATASLSHDYSENGTVILAGRCALADANAPVYWAVRDNRVHFSSFKDLTDKDKMLLANQVLLSYAHRSEKDDLKSAALAVSERGHFYVAMNTQELPTMDWAKECAEVNVTKIVKQLSRSNDKIRRMYVLGGLTDGQGNMHQQDHLIGMCMRCVETTSAVMAPDSYVTILPANDGTSPLALRETDAIENIQPYEAWQVPFAVLKSPSIVKFSEEGNQLQAAAFHKMQGNLAHFATPSQLKSTAQEQEVNQYMLATLAQGMAARGGVVTQLGMAVLRIVDGKGNARFVEATQFKGGRDNATLSPISGAVLNAALPIPTALGEHVDKVYLMGYNADGAPYDMSAASADRLLKRIPKDKIKSVEVVCIPLNDGSRYPAEQVQHTSAHALAPTAFNGSKQHSFHSGACCSR